MTQASQKIVLSPSRDIPFNKLVLSQSNVRRIKSGVSIEDLAEDIARRTLLQSLNVRAVVDAEGNETGMFEVPAGGRRYRALERLVKQKRLSRTAPVPCVIRESADISAEEDSLAENSQREPLHPLDQFRAFQTLREQGQGDEAIAARFFVTPAIVRQRLKLASVSDRLLALYAEDELTLDQLMAFTVTNDHARQEQVWEALARNPYKEAYQIRRMLTEGAVRASDRRARFIGAEAYEAAGGDISRDLFQTDDGGWFQDPALLDRLVSDKLAAAAETVAAEGWKWISADIGFDYGHTRGLRALPSTSSLTDEEHATYEALSQEYAALEDRRLPTSAKPARHLGGGAPVPQPATNRISCRQATGRAGANRVARSGASPICDVEADHGHSRTIVFAPTRHYGCAAWRPPALSPSLLVSR